MADRSLAPVRGLTDETGDGVADGAGEGDHGERAGDAGSPACTRFDTEPAQTRRSFGGTLDLRGRWVEAPPWVGVWLVSGGSKPRPGWVEAPPWVGVWLASPDSASQREQGAELLHPQ